MHRTALPVGTRLTISGISFTITDAPLRGGSALLYPAVADGSAMQMLIKEWFPRRGASRSGEGKVYATDTEGSAVWLEREAELSQLASAHACQVFPVLFQEKGYAVLKRSAEDAVSLRQLLSDWRQNPPVSPVTDFPDLGRVRLGLKIVSSLLTCLNTVHTRAKLLHCDLSDGNVFWAGGTSVNGTAFLADFGSAVALDREGQVKIRNMEELPPASPGFRAPELESAPGVLTVSTDLYSVGMLLYCIALPEPETWNTCMRLQEKNAVFDVSGYLLRSGCRKMREDVAQCRVPEEIRVELERIICRAAARSPEQRYLSAADMESDVSELYRKVGALERPHVVANRMAQPTDGYVSRPALLSRINEAYQSGAKLVFLTGVTGIGKTQLAQEYAVRYHSSVLELSLADRSKEEYDWSQLVSGIPVSNADCLSARELNQLRESFLEEADESLLIIIDNFNRLDQGFLSQLRSRCGGARLLITTQIAESLLDAERVIPVRNDADFCIALIERQLHRTLQPQERTAAEKLLPDLKSHTMCLKEFAAQVYQDGESFEQRADEVWHDFSKLDVGKVDVWKQDDGRYSGTPYQIMTQLFLRGVPELSQRQKEILAILCRQRGDWVESAYLCELIGDLPERGWREARDALTELIKSNLVQVMYTAEGEQLVTVHPLRAMALVDGDKPVIRVPYRFARHIARNGLVRLSRGSVWPGSSELDLSYFFYTYRRERAIAYIQFCAEEIKKHAPFPEDAYYVPYDAFFHISPPGEILFGGESAEYRDANWDFGDMRYVSLLTGEEGCALYLSDGKGYDVCLLNASQQLRYENRYWEAEEKPAQNGAFSSAKLIKYLNIGASDEAEIPAFVNGCPVKAIGSFVFSEDDRVKYARIPDGVEIIQDYAFSECKNLRAVTVPDSVTELEDWAFDELHKDFIIYCSKDSAAEKYAKKWGEEYITRRKWMLKLSGFLVYNICFVGMISVWSLGALLNRAIRAFLSMVGEPGLIVGVFFSVSLTIHLLLNLSDFRALRSIPTRYFPARE